MRPIDGPLASAAMSRRAFVRTTMLAALAGAAPPWIEAAPGPRTQPPRRSGPAARRLAVVATAYHYLSHAYHLCGRFFHGYSRDGKHHFPDHGIVTLYVQQRPENDLSQEIASANDCKLCTSVEEAITLGANRLAVDGVLLIGEHGDYPYNAKGQKLYPRYELFQEIVAAFRKVGRSAPVFCDKHLSYDWKKAREMVATARQLNVPLMAGSSLPVTWRRPEWELPLGTRIREALVASRGELEIFGIHALEALQCVVERRLRGEQGVRTVRCLEGDEVWKAGDRGEWSWELLEHALGCSDSLNVGDARTNCRHFRPPPNRPSFPRGPIAFQVEYRDGLKATVLLLNGHVDDTTLAARIDGDKIVSTLFYLPPPPGARFLEALTMRIEDFLMHQKPPYPVERTLLTGGILDFVLESRVQGCRRLETPELTVRYDPPVDSGFMRGDWRQPA